MKLYRHRLLSTTTYLALAIGGGALMLGPAGSSGLLGADGGIGLGSMVLAACNPCATNPCNPCAAKAPCNPCAAAADCPNPCNPCCPTPAAGPCNPCAAANPCAANNPCNPCNPCKTN